MINRAYNRKQPHCAFRNAAVALFFWQIAHGEADALPFLVHLKNADPNDVSDGDDL